MKVIINIDDKLYKIIKDPKQLATMVHASRCAEAVENGTPIPKGHGRIIDESQATQCGWDFVNHHAKTNAPTIIEADKKESEK